MDKLALNPTRKRWLEYLAAVEGWHAWAHMPRCESGKRAVDNRTWLPMVNIGWIEAEYICDDELMDWTFRITDAGRAELAKET